MYTPPRRRAFFEVRLVYTEHALHFFDLADIDVGIKTYNDQDEWKLWNKRSDPVLHIELKKWADVLLISPLGANTMAKLSYGMSDNLLTCVARAWNFTKPAYIAPAMNTDMYKHVVTREHRQRLTDFGYKEIACIEKTLICGDTGIGAMAEVSTIVDIIESEFNQQTS